MVWLIHWFSRLHSFIHSFTRSFGFVGFHRIGIGLAPMALRVYGTLTPDELNQQKKQLAARQARHVGYVPGKMYYTPPALTPEQMEIVEAMHKRENLKKDRRVELDDAYEEEAAAREDRPFRSKQEREQHEADERRKRSKTSSSSSSQQQENEQSGGQESANRQRRRPQLLDDETLYTLLELDDLATMKEVRKAYRKLALVFHPDKRRHDDNNENAEEDFKRIHDAYRILSDDQLRKEYDLELRKKREEKFRREFEEKAARSMNGFRRDDEGNYANGNGAASPKWQKPKFSNEAEERAYEKALHDAMMRAAKKRAEEARKRADMLARKPKPIPLSFVVTLAQLREGGVRQTLDFERRVLSTTATRVVESMEQDSVSVVLNRGMKFGTTIIFEGLGHQPDPRKEGWEGDVIVTVVRSADDDMRMWRPIAASELATDAGFLNVGSLAHAPAVAEILHGEMNQIRTGHDRAGCNDAKHVVRFDVEPAGEVGDVLFYREAFGHVAWGSLAIPDLMDELEKRAWALNVARQQQHRKNDMDNDDDDDDPFGAFDETCQIVAHDGTTASSAIQYRFAVAPGAGLPSLDDPYSGHRDGHAFVRCPVASNHGTCPPPRFPRTPRPIHLWGGDGDAHDVSASLLTDVISSATASESTTANVVVVLLPAPDAPDLPARAPSGACTRLLRMMQEKRAAWHNAGVICTPPLRATIVRPAPGFYGLNAELALTEDESASLSQANLILLDIGDDGDDDGDDSGEITMSEASDANADDKIAALPQLIDLVGQLQGRVVFAEHDDSIPTMRRRIATRGAPSTSGAILGARKTGERFNIDAISRDLKWARLSFDEMETARSATIQEPLRQAGSTPRAYVMLKHDELGQLVKVDGIELVSASLTQEVGPGSPAALRKDTVEAEAMNASSQRAARLLSRSGVFRMMNMAWIRGTALGAVGNAVPLLGKAAVSAEARDRALREADDDAEDAEVADDALDADGDEEQEDEQLPGKPGSRERLEALLERRRMMREVVERRARLAKRAFIARARIKRAGVGVAFDVPPLYSMGWGALGERGDERGLPLLLRVSDDEDATTIISATLDPPDDALAAASRREMRQKAAGGVGERLNDQATRPGPVCGVLSRYDHVRVSWTGEVVDGKWKALVCARDVVKK